MDKTKKCCYTLERGQNIDIYTLMILFEFCIAEVNSSVHMETLT